MGQATPRVKWCYDMLVDVVRSILVFLHLIFFASAFALVFWTDFSILYRGIEKTLFRKTAALIVLILSMLWITGLGIIYLDTQFILGSFAQKPKLLMKLVCVTILSANGVFLHLVCFKVLMQIDYLCQTKAKIICIGGSISTSNWLLAAYIGSAAMLNQLPMTMLLAIYFFVLLCSVLVGLLIAPLVQVRINLLRARGVIKELGIKPQLYNTHRTHW